VHMWTRHRKFLLLNVQKVSIFSGRLITLKHIRGLGALKMFHIYDHCSKSSYVFRGKVNLKVLMRTRDTENFYLLIVLIVS
jgi:hypothetical protein